MDQLDNAELCSQCGGELVTEWGAGESEITRCPQGCPESYRVD